MQASEVLQLFEAQLKRRTEAEGIKLKVLCAPLAVREPGISLRLLPRKVLPPPRTQAARTEDSRALVVALLLAARIDSDTALRRFLSASEFLIDQSQDVRRLEDTQGNTIPNTRIVWTTSPEDAVFEDPAEDTVVWAREEWKATIFFT